MKSLLNIFIAFLITIATAHGQQGPPMKRIHAAKITYITDRLHLSPEQSDNFLPLYNSYEGELRGIRQSFFAKYRGANNDNHDDAAARQYIEDDLGYQQQVIELKRKYNDQFLKVLSPSQLADLYKAEREFRQMLMQQLKHRRDGKFK